MALHVSSLTVVDSNHLLDDELVHGLRGWRAGLAAVRFLHDRRALANVVRYLLLPEAVARVEVADRFLGNQLHVARAAVALGHCKKDTDVIICNLMVNHTATTVSCIHYVLHMYMYILLARTEVVIEHF